MFILNSYSQKEIEFRNDYASGKEYHQQTITSSDIVIKYFGSPELIKYLKSQGISNPQRESDITLMEVIYRVGNTSSGIAPFEVEYIETGQSGDKQIINNGDKLIGTIDLNNKLRLTSISNDTVNEETAEQLLRLFEFGFSAETFNGKRMKVGDTLVKNNTMNIPVAESQIELVIFNIYKLKKIKNGTAYFDITQRASINTGMEGISLTASGKGKGKCEYDIKESHLVINTNTLNLKMLLTMNDDIRMEVEQTTVTNSTTLIK